MTSNEAWVTIPGYGGLYEASTKGRVRSKQRIVRKRHKSGGFATQKYPARVLAGYLDKGGYRRLHLCVDGARHVVAEHRLVALAFHGEPEPGQECCHGNGISDDNRPENLRWDTHFNNNQDRVRHGTYLTGTSHPMSKFDETLIDRVRCGAVGLHKAIGLGMSRTHFYRLKRNAARLEAESVAEGILP